MKKKDLEDKISELEKKYPHHNVNNTEMFNLQYETNKLFIQIIRDFNEKTETYNKYLLFYTVAIAILTAVLVLVTFVNK